MSDISIMTFKGHTSMVSIPCISCLLLIKVRGCEFSPSGSSILSCSRDKTLAVWDVKSGTRKLTLQGHTARVMFIHHVIYIGMGLFLFT